MPCPLSNDVDYTGICVFKANGSMNLHTPFFKTTVGDCTKNIPCGCSACLDFRISLISNIENSGG